MSIFLFYSFDVVLLIIILFPYYYLVSTRIVCIEPHRFEGKYIANDEIDMYLLHLPASKAAKLQ